MSYVNPVLDYYAAVCINLRTLTLHTITLTFELKAKSIFCLWNVHINFCFIYIFYFSVKARTNISKDRRTEPTDRQDQ